MAPLSRSSRPKRCARARATVLLPAPAGPSMATIRWRHERLAITHLAFVPLAARLAFGCCDAAGPLGAGFEARLKPTRLAPLYRRDGRRVWQTAVRGLAAPPGRGLSNPPGRRGLPELVVVDVRPFPAGRGLPELAPAGRGLPKGLPGPAGLRKLPGRRAAGAASEAEAGLSPAPNAGRGSAGTIGRCAIRPGPVKPRPIESGAVRFGAIRPGGDRTGACPFLFRRLRTFGSQA